MNTMNHASNAAPLERLMVFTGNANPRLGQEVARHLNLSLGRAIVGKFSDGEVMVELLENVRGKDVFVLQSTCAPTNDNLMELLVMIDALKRSSAARVTAAIPYFGYARQDRRPRSARVAISAKVVANIDRKSTRLNSSHVRISYAVFCLKKKKNIKKRRDRWRTRNLYKTLTGTQTESDTASPQRSRRQLSSDGT